MKDINKIMPKIPGLRWGAVQRFFSKVKKTNNCWIWTAATDSQGYGRFNPDGIIVAAHRFSYELIHGKIPNDKELDHLCRNPLCVNPDHLEAVTHQVNCIRGISPAAKNILKTHCPNGHKFTEENTYRRPSRPHQRECKICKNQYSKNWNHGNILVEKIKN